MPSRAGSIRSAGNAASQATPRQARPTSQRSASSSPMPIRAAQEAVARLLPELLRVGRGSGGTARRGRRAGSRSCGTARCSCGARAARVSRWTTRAAWRWRPFRCSSVSSFRAELEPFAGAAVVLVHQPRPEHPVRDLLAVDRRGQRRLELGDPLGLLADEVAEVALARELPQLARGAGRRRPRRRARARCRAWSAARAARRSATRSYVSLMPGEVEVRLLVELGDEAVGVGAERVDLPLAERLRACGFVG